VKTAWQFSKLILGLVIGAGYLYNIAAGGLPEPEAHTLIKAGYYGGTVAGLLASALLVVSGLRGIRRRQ